MITVSQLIIYPFKSARGIASTASQPLMGMNARLRSAPSKSQIAIGDVIELL